MSHFVTFCGMLPFNAATVDIPATRGPHALGLEVSYSRQTLPTDAIGTFALTLTNVIVGSSIQIEDQFGTTTLYNGTAATSTPLINLSAYAGGSSLNDLRIKVRKGTASPFYRPFETLTTAIVGSQSIYVAQIADE